MRGMLDAVRGSLKEELRMDIISNNLANSTVVGFKGDRVSFQDLLSQRPPFQRATSGKNDRPIDSALVRVQTDMSQGHIQATGNRLDFAIKGEGYFKVSTPDGVRYTRKGNFRLDTEGYLVTQQGYRVLGKGGPINIPNDDVQVDKRGRVLVEGTEVDQLDVVSVSDSKGLIKDEGVLFQTDPGVEELPLTPETSIQQGYVEGSNVNVVQEMVHMIHSMRAFESYQKVIKAMDTIDSEAINDVGRLH